MAFSLLLNDLIDVHDPWLIHHQFFIDLPRIRDLSMEVADVKPRNSSGRSVQPASAHALKTATSGRRP
jgi:hypothetical protein